MPKFRMFSAYLDEGDWEDIYAEDEIQAISQAWEIVQSRIRFDVKPVEEGTEDD